MRRAVGFDVAARAERYERADRLLRSRSVRRAISLGLPIDEPVGPPNGDSERSTRLALLSASVEVDTATDVAADSRAHPPADASAHATSDDSAHATSDAGTNAAAGQSPDHARIQDESGSRPHLRYGRSRR